MAAIERSFPVFVLAASAAVLGAALVAQYWGGLAPCELCLKERWPWIAAVAISSVATAGGSRRGLPRVTLLLTAVFAAGSALAFYHVGVERHWFPGPSACTAPPGSADTLAALKAQLLHTGPVPCDRAAWELWGVSLAGWNLVASLAMAGLSLLTFWQCRGARRRV